MIQMNLEQSINKMCEDSLQSGWDKPRMDKVKELLYKILPDYEKVLGLSQLDIFNAIEGRRTYSTPNYYQEANFPTLGDGIEIFETKEDFKNKFPSKQFICPSCKSVSTNPQICNSGKKMNKKEICNWKSFGLFGTLDGGYRFVIKKEFLEHPVVYDIFKPKELS